jgi:hypothetical protein
LDQFDAESSMFLACADLLLAVALAAFALRLAFVFDRVRGVECVVRIHLQNLPLQDCQGHRLTPAALLERADTGMVDPPVRIPKRSTRRWKHA